MDRKLAMTVALLALAAPATARMYQWVDPITHTTQLSGRPPMWYRSGTAGPRVFVFDNGQVIDETGRALSSDRAQTLRDAALRSVNQEQTTVARERELAALRKAEPAANEKEPSTPQADQTDAQNSDAAADAAPTPPADDSVAQLKAIIDAWDQQQTQKARRVLESNNPPRTE